MHLNKITTKSRRGFHLDQAQRSIIELLFHFYCFVVAVVAVLPRGLGFLLANQTVLSLYTCSAVFFIDVVYDYCIGGDRLKVEWKCQR